MSFIFRRPGPLIVVVTSAFGGAAYRYTAQKSSSSSESLNPHTFTPYTLAEKTPVSSTSAIFTLRSRDGSSDPEAVKEGWKRSVWSVQVKQPQLQIARAYTPLPPLKRAQDGEAQDIRLLIRQEEGGEVSTYLHRLPEESTIELRGPNIECELPHDIKEVIFLAGGTGIAPAMQVAQALERRTGSRMDLLWANRRREECIGGVSDESGSGTRVQTRLGWWKSLFGIDESDAQERIVDNQKSLEKGVVVKELEALKSRTTEQSRGLIVQYYVDEENTFIQLGDVAKRLGLDSPETKGSKVILVSGPDGFIKYWAGEKLWQSGQEVQGPLGGVLAKMDLKGWKVFKL
jgi:ferredoxin-NADP reductase